ncbi:hypothetical protein [Roseibium sp.]|uniref:hypothetical protein n=1 Tax=Roseibium sp. TaxID=1936156 RepID=UPI003267F8D0
MTHQQATRRYFMIFVPSMIGYMVATIGVVWARDHADLPAMGLYVLAALPIIAILCTFWAHWRFITEIDEFLRTIQIKAVLFGLVCLMVMASVWGTLENLAGAPALDVFWLVPTFWLSYGAAALVITRRDGGVF